MNIAFFTPPAGKTRGGLAAAIEDLRTALELKGVKVSSSLDSKTDVVHFHGLWELPFQAIARRCRRAGIPYVASPHGMLEPWAFRHKRWKKLPYFHLLERRFLRKAAALLATSPGEARNLAARLPATSIETIPLGLATVAKPAYHEARRALGWRDEELVLLFLSRIDPKKGLELLFEALARVDLPGARLVIVGGGDPRYIARLQAAEKLLNLPRVEWAGEHWGDDRWKYFQGADLFCLPSHSENFGLAVLEALWVGTPVLTTHATPWPEFAGDNRGYFTDPTVAGVTDALGRAANNLPWAADRRDALAQWTIEKFDSNTLVTRYLDLYGRLSKKPR